MLMGFKKVLKAKKKRIVLGKDGLHRPQYKGLLFWCAYYNPCNGHREQFFYMNDCIEFLKAKHHQDLEDIRRYKERGIYQWEPTE